RHRRAARRSRRAAPTRCAHATARWPPPSRAPSGAAGRSARIRRPARIDRLDDAEDLALRGAQRRTQDGARAKPAALVDALVEALVARDVVDDLPAPGAGDVARDPEAGVDLELVDLRTPTRGRELQPLPRRIEDADAAGFEGEDLDGGVENRGHDLAW